MPVPQPTRVNTGKLPLLPSGLHQAHMQPMLTNPEHQLSPSPRAEVGMWHVCVLPEFVFGCVVLRRVM